MTVYLQDDITLRESLSKAANSYFTFDHRDKKEGQYQMFNARSRSSQLSVLVKMQSNTADFIYVSQTIASNL